MSLEVSGGIEPNQKFEAALSTLESLTQLSTEEKSDLQERIHRRDPQVMGAIEACQTPEQMQEALVQLVRAMEVEAALVDNPPMLIRERSLQSAKLGFIKLNSQKAATTKSSLKHILKIAQSLHDQPDQIKNRKIKLTNNFLHKKLIEDVPGAWDVLRSMGWVVNKDSLTIERQDIDHDLLTSLIGEINRKISELDEEIKTPKEPKTRVRCKGNCGFWGDEKTDDYCSLCFRKKFLGVNAASAERKEPQKCIRGCGFWGSDKNGGLCTVCYKKENENAKMTWKIKFKMAKVKVRAMYLFKSSVRERKQQTRTNRCWFCNRKIGISGIECRCGYVFCGQHRYANMHNCSYDLKKQHQLKIKKDNPKFFDEKMRDKA